MRAADERSTFWLGLVVVLGTVNALDPGHLLGTVAWIVLSVVYVESRFGLARLHHPVVLCFVLGLIPYVAGFVALAFTPEYELAPAGARLSWVGLTTFLVICHLSAVPGATFRKQWSTASTNLYALGLGASGLSVTAGLLFFRSHGIALLAANAEAGRVTASAGAGLTLSLLTAGMSVGVPALVLGSLHLTGPARTTARGVVLTDLVVVLLTGSRALVIHGLVAAVVAYYVGRRGEVPVSRLVVTGALAAYGSVVIGQLRYAGGSTGLGLLGARRLAVDPYVSGLLQRYESVHGPVGLELFRIAFATYAPGQQPLVSDVLKERLGLSFAGGGVSVPLPAEAFVSAGWVGVPLLCGLAALAVGVLSHSMHRAGDQAALARGIVLAVLWSGVFGAGVATTLASYVLPAVLLMTALTLLTRGRRRPVATPRERRPRGPAVKGA